MFSYYGSKSKVVHLYPPPKHGLIIEPFAGSARYALRYFERDVVLVDKYDKIIAIWNYLQQASEGDILGLPKLRAGNSIENYKHLSKIEKCFLGFLVCRGMGSPRLKVSKWRDANHSPYVEDDLRATASQLYKIRHWQFIHGDYQCLANTKATWFIDPPYYKGGEHYVHKSKQIDFDYLRLWSESRQGQVIVCENSAASWMPFHRLARMHGSMKATTEVFWTNEPVPVQAPLWEVA